MTSSNDVPEEQLIDKRNQQQECNEEDKIISFFEDKNLCNNSNEISENTTAEKNNNKIQEHTPDDTEGAGPNNSRKSHQQSVIITPSSTSKHKILPLLHKTKEEKFSSATKWTVFLIVLISQILDQASTNAFYPALPEIQKDLNTTPTMANAIVAIQSLLSGLLSAVWASYSDRYGRRPVFIISNFFAVAGNIGSSLAPNIHVLIGVQVISAVGAAAAYALGVGIISDIFKDYEKGRALSWNAAMNPYSMAIAPLVGGALTQYFGWRSIFWFFVIAYSVLWIAIVVLLPETNTSAHQQPDELVNSYDNEKNISETTRKKRMINPFSSLKLLRFPNMLMVCVYLGLIGFTNNVMGISFAWAYSTEYQFTSTLVGLFFLVGLVGNTAGTWLGGWLSDKIYMRRVTKAKENNQQIFPEMRLSQLGVLVAVFSMAGSFVTYGWCIEKQVHFSVGIICQVFVLFGVTFASCFLNVYAVQCFPKHGSSAQACVQTLKCILFAIGRLWTIDLQNLVGIGILYTIFAGVLLVTCPFVTYIQLNSKKWQRNQERMNF